MSFTIRRNLRLFERHKKLYFCRFISDGFRQPDLSGLAYVSPVEKIRNIG